MLDCWLKGGNEHSKIFLKRALEKMGWNVKDSKPNEAGKLIMMNLILFFESLQLVCCMLGFTFGELCVCVCSSPPPILLQTNCNLMTKEAKKAAKLGKKGLRYSSPAWVDGYYGQTAHMNTVCLSNWR